MPLPLQSPQFGTYAANDVHWLLSDGTRARVVDSGTGRNGAPTATRELFPIEYIPGPEYLSLFRQELRSGAGRLARAIGVVTEMVLAQRGRNIVLASIARAGTPIGILMRRWAKLTHDLDIPHYSMSVVRGHGADRVALDYLARHHEAADVVFVDGWTGKGVIVGELSKTLATHPAAFSSDVIALADPGGCVSACAFREDVLIPSALLGSVVSGLISRTDVCPERSDQEEFHGARFLTELLNADVSTDFLDEVTDEFSTARNSAMTDGVLPRPDRPPSGIGALAIDRLARRYAIADIHRIKPGVCEVTRLLLRHSRLRLLIERGSRSISDSMRLLAAERGIVVEEVTGLSPYACIGITEDTLQRLDKTQSMDATQWNVA